MSRAQDWSLERETGIFLCYAEAQDLLSLRVVSSAWRQSVDEDNVWAQLCLHDLLHTRLDFPNPVEFMCNHRFFIGRHAI